MISRKFLKSSLLYTMSGALPMASMILLLPFYLLLPVDQFGALAIYTTFSTLLQVIVTYSFDTSLYVYYHDLKKDRLQLSVFISSAFIFIAICGLGVLLFSFLAGDLFFDHFYSAGKIVFYPYGLLSVVTAVFQSFFKVQSSLNQTREMPVLFFWSNVLSFSLIAVFTIVGLKIFPNTLIGPIGGRALAAMVAGGWAFVRTIREFGFHFDFPLLRKSFTFNNSSFLYNVQQWFINSFDRTIIGIYLTLQDVGTYDLAFKCVLFIQFIIDGLYNSIQPKVLGMVAEQNEKGSTVAISRYYNGLMVATMLLVTMLVFGVPLVFNSPFLPDKFHAYRDALKYIPFIGVAYFVRALRYYFVLPIGALKYVKPLPYIYAVVSGIKIGLMILFIKRFGIYAVIGSDFVSRIIEVAILYLVLRSKFNFKFNVLKLILAPAFLGAMIFAMEFAGLFQETIRHSFYVILCLALLFWTYRNEIGLLKISAALK